MNPILSRCFMKSFSAFRYRIWFAMLGSALILGSFTSCSTYYQRNLEFQQQVLAGNLEGASKSLNKKKKDQEGRNRLLYLMNMGWVQFMLQDRVQSNALFEEADRMIEDYQKNLGLQALSLLTNPTIQPYRPEDFETVMPNYFKALNYLQLGNSEAAGVEVNKINNRLNALNDQYKDHKNRYQKDAFAHLIMGLAYESARDYNNAFIAYRNALEVYETDYPSQFGVACPEQLKTDVLRTAYLSGFGEELRFFEQKFGKKYSHSKGTGGELVFLWQNGLGPVKAEWSINFSKLDGQNGWITLANEEMGLSYPFYIGDRPADEKNAFGNLSFVRIAFPKYLERKPVFQKAELVAGATPVPLERVQDINAIAFKTLNDRMLREMGQALLRLATKQALEAVVRHENKDMGTLISIANALSEQADTRNWQTLPHSIFYARLSLPEGKQTVQLKTFSSGSEQVKQFEFEIKKGKTEFFVYQSLESFPPMD